MSDFGPDHPLVKQFFAHGFDASLKGMSLVSMKDGQASVRLEVSPEVQNMGGTLHGGAIATLVDDAGTLAIMSADTDSRPGVTTDLNVSYFSAARGGEAVLAEATALKTGKTLGFVSVDIKTEGGKLVAQGRMTKFLGR